MNERMSNQFFPPRNKPQFERASKAACRESKIRSTVTGRHGVRVRPETKGMKRQKVLVQAFLHVYDWHLGHQRRRGLVCCLVMILLRRGYVYTWRLTSANPCLTFVVILKLSLAARRDMFQKNKKDAFPNFDHKGAAHIGF